MLRFGLVDVLRREVEGIQQWARGLHVENRYLDQAETFFSGLRVAAYGRSLAIRLLYFLVIIGDQVTCQLYTVLLIVNLKVIQLHFV